MNDTIRIFIGFDQNEAVAYHTLCHSILSRASQPVSIMPIKRSLLGAVHDRPLEPEQSNEFSFTRFLVPHLCEYRGRAIFMDCDMMLRTDIAELWNHPALNLNAVAVVKHDYTPRDDFKYLGAVQYKYPRKNWSSVMLFNCGHKECRSLTPGYVNTASGMDLHRFNWCDDAYIGELEPEWNWLVGEYTYNPDVKNIHWTVGGPWFNEYQHVDYAEEWFNERALMTQATQIFEPKTVVSER